MSTEIKAGDVVKLKSGGPTMTVSEIGYEQGYENGPQSAWCDWFDDKNQPQTKVFKLSALQLF